MRFTSAIQVGSWAGLRKGIGRQRIAPWGGSQPSAPSKRQGKRRGQGTTVLAAPGMARPATVAPKTAHAAMQVWVASPCSVEWFGSSWLDQPSSTMVVTTAPARAGQPSVSNSTAVSKRQQRQHHEPKQACASHETAKPASLHQSHPFPHYTRLPGCCCSCSFACSFACATALTRGTDVARHVDLVCAHHLQHIRKRVCAVRGARGLNVRGAAGHVLWNVQRCSMLVLRQAQQTGALRLLLCATMCSLHCAEGAEPTL